MSNALSHSPLLSTLRRHSGTVGLVLASWLVLTACEEEKAAAPAKTTQSGNADLFSDFDKAPKKAPPPPPPVAAPPQGGGGGGGGDTSGLIPVLDPQVAAECKQMREEEKRLRTQSEQFRQNRVAPAAAALERANSAFGDCQEDFSCINDERQYATLGTKARRAEQALEAEEGELMVMEGALHDVSQKISVKCGDF